MIKLKLLKHISGILIIAIFIFYLVQTAQIYIDQANQLNIVPSTPSIFLSFGIFAIWLFLMALAWELVLKKICFVRTDGLKELYVKSSLSRYIPGKIWGLAIVVAELSKKNIKHSTAIFGYFVYQVNFLVGTGTLAILFLPFVFKLPPQHSSVGASILVLGLLGIYVWLLRPEAFSIIFKRTKFNVLEKHFYALKKLKKEWALVFISMMILAALQGAAVFPMAASLSGNTNLWTVVFAYPLSRLIGQVAFIFPGGLGVREGAFIVLMTPFLPIEITTVIAIWARILSLASEIIGYATSIAIRKFCSNSNNGKSI